MVNALLTCLFLFGEQLVPFTFQTLSGILQKEKRKKKQTSTDSL